MGTVQYVPHPTQPGGWVPVPVPSPSPPSGRDTSSSGSSGGSRRSTDRPPAPSHDTQSEIAIYNPSTGWRVVPRFQEGSGSIQRLYEEEQATRTSQTAKKEILAEERRHITEQKLRGEHGITGRVVEVTVPISLREETRQLTAREIRQAELGDVRKQLKTPLLRKEARKKLKERENILLQEIALVPKRSPSVFEVMYERFPDSHGRTLPQRITTDAKRVLAKPHEYTVKERVSQGTIPMSILAGDIERARRKALFGQRDPILPDKGEVKTPSKKILRIDREKKRLVVDVPLAKKKSAEVMKIIKSKPMAIATEFPKQLGKDVFISAGLGSSAEMYARRELVKRNETVYAYKTFYPGHVIQAATSTGMWGAYAVLPKKALLKAYPAVLGYNIFQTLQDPSPLSISRSAYMATVPLLIKAWPKTKSTYIKLKDKYYSWKLTRRYKGQIITSQTIRDIQKSGGPLVTTTTEVSTELRGRPIERVVGASISDEGVTYQKIKFIQGKPQRINPKEISDIIELKGTRAMYVKAGRSFTQKQIPSKQPQPQHYRYGYQDDYPDVFFVSKEPYQGVMARGKFQRMLSRLFGDDLSAERTIPGYTERGTTVITVDAKVTGRRLPRWSAEHKYMAKRIAQKQKQIEGKKLLTGEKQGLIDRTFYLEHDKSSTIGQPKLFTLEEVKIMSPPVQTIDLTQVKAVATSGGLMALKRFRESEHLKKRKEGITKIIDKEKSKVKTINLIDKQIRFPESGLMALKRFKERERDRIRKESFSKLVKDKKKTITIKGDIIPDKTGELAIKRFKEREIEKKKKRNVIKIVKSASEGEFVAASTTTQQVNKDGTVVLLKQKLEPPKKSQKTVQISKQKRKAKQKRGRKLTDYQEGRQTTTPRQTYVQEEYVYITTPDQAQRQRQEPKIRPITEPKPKIKSKVGLAPFYTHMTRTEQMPIPKQIFKPSLKPKQKLGRKSIQKFHPIYIQISNILPDQDIAVAQLPKQDIVPIQIPKITQITTTTTTTTTTTPPKKPPQYPPKHPPPIILPKGGIKRDKKIRDQTQEAYNAYVKRKRLKRGKGKYFSRGYEKANTKPLTRKAALGLGASKVDTYTNRSFTIRKTRGKPQTNLTLEQKWRRLQHKFRRSKKSHTFVEKTKYAIDSIMEKRGIPYEAAKLRSRGIFKMARRKRRKKKKKKISWR